MLRRARAAVKTLPQTENSLSTNEDVVSMDKARAVIPARMLQCPHFPKIQRDYLNFALLPRPPWTLLLANNIIYFLSGDWRVLLATACPRVRGDSRTSSSFSKNFKARVTILSLFLSSTHQPVCGSRDSTACIRLSLFPKIMIVICRLPKWIQLIHKRTLLQKLACIHLLFFPNFW